MIHLKLGSVVGSAQFFAKKPDGTERVSDVEHNEILKGLYNRAMAGGYYRDTNGIFCIGTGDTANSATTAGMEALVSNASTFVSNTKTCAFDAGTRTLTVTEVRRFKYALGSINATLKEAGLLLNSYASDGLTHTRLVLATPFVVTSDEELYVEYTITATLTLPAASVTVPVNLNGTLTNFTMETTVPNPDNWRVMDILQHILDDNPVKASRYRRSELLGQDAPEYQPTQSEANGPGIRTINKYWSISQPNWYSGIPEVVETIQIGDSPLVVFNFTPGLPKSDKEDLTFAVAQDLTVLSPYAS